MPLRRNFLSIGLPEFNGETVSWNDSTVEPQFSELQPSGKPPLSGNFSEQQFFFLVKTCNLTKILARAEKFSVTENSAKVRFYCIWQLLYRVIIVHSALCYGLISTPWLKNNWALYSQLTSRWNKKFAFVIVFIHHYSGSQLFRNFNNSTKFGSTKRNSYPLFQLFAIFDREHLCARSLN